MPEKTRRLKVSGNCDTKVFDAAQIFAALKHGVVAWPGMQGRR